ncbi:MAG TPA: peroxidase family protein [Polyangiales bacterium]|nr:peroxidase family protein [Polyangiales bacterium]
MERDLSRDGWTNRIRNAVLTSLRPLWALSNGIRWIHGPVNRFLIDNAVKQSRSRPHPLSTFEDAYTSVESLRNKRYFSRHLPAVKPRADLPDVADVAELFRRTGECKRSPKSTMLFASYAQWFTDGFLLSDSDDRRKNHSTHELDLAQLYGTTEEITNALRLKRDETGQRGKLKSQVLRGEEYAPFLYDEAGKRIVEFDALPKPLGLPDGMSPQQLHTLFAFGGERSNTTPQTAMLNVLMLREHNRLCGEIEAAHPEWDDDRVFQTARNVLIAMQLQIVIGEYINHISPYHHAFELDPSAAWNADWNRPVWFAVEFNLLYRWHSLLPDHIEWPNRSYAINDWRLDNRPLIEVGLAAALEATSKQPSGEIGLGNTPQGPLLEVEKRAIMQGRETHLASYNDYREAMGYPRVERFEQISSSPEVIAGLRKVYGSVDRIEFYVGLFAEDPRPNGAVPSLLGRMVGVDAFSQALVHPLYSKYVYNEDTFSRVGMRRIAQTRTLADLVARNVKGGRELVVTMTQDGAARKPGIGRPKPRTRIQTGLRELARSDFMEVTQ